MYTSGEKPGKGTYKCQKCGKEITIDEDLNSPAVRFADMRNGTRLDDLII
jgi:hypothetical protein